MGHPPRLLGVLLLTSAFGVGCPSDAPPTKSIDPSPVEPRGERDDPEAEVTPPPQQAPLVDPQASSHDAAHTFSSPLELVVLEWDDAHGLVRLGETPGEVAVPEGTPWMVRPRGPLDPSTRAALAEALEGHTRVGLSLVEQTLEPGDLEGLGECAALTFLELRRCTGLAPEAFASLAGWGRLEALRLRDGQAEDPILAAIAEITTLRDLDLANNGRISDDGLRTLGALTQLERLDLSACGRLTGAGLAGLAGLSQLETLRLDLCATIDDAGLAQLPAFASLKGLFLGGTRVTELGIETLARFSSLRRLDLSGLPLLDPNLETLVGLKQLEHLTLTGCRALSGEGLRRLGTSTTLRRLEVARTQIDGDGLRALPRALLALDLSATGVTDEDLAALPPQLVSLQVGGTALTDAGVQRLVALPLESLSLAATGVTDEGLVALAVCGTLRELDLRLCPAIGARGLRALVEALPLEGLDLSGASVGDAALAALEGAAQLRFLGLADCAGFTAEGLESLGGLEALEELRLAHCPGVRDGTLETIAGLGRLRTLDLQGCTEITTEGARVLLGLPKLTEVWLWDSGVARPGQIQRRLVQ